MGVHSLCSSGVNSLTLQGFRSQPSKRDERQGSGLGGFSRGVFGRPVESCSEFRGSSECHDGRHSFGRYLSVGAKRRCSIGRALTPNGRISYMSCHQHSGYHSVMDTGFSAGMYYPQGRSTQYLRTLGPNTIKSRVFGTRNLKNIGYLDPLGYDSMKVRLLPAGSEESSTPAQTTQSRHHDFYTQSDKQGT